MKLPSLSRTSIAFWITVLIIVFAIVGLSVYNKYFATDAVEGEDGTFSGKTQVIRVDTCSAKANDSNGGDSWDASLKTLKAALEKAPTDTSQILTQIWIRKTDDVCPAIVENISISRKNRLEIYGGFDGNETELTKRNQENITQIVGNNNTPIWLTASDFVTLSSLLITNGLSSDQSPSGGAIYIDSSKNTTLKKVTIKDSQKNSASSDGGGGLKIVNSSATLENVSIENCTSIGSGGAIFSSKSDLTIKDIILLKNESVGSGGAVYFESGRLSIIKAQLLSNTSNGFGGGLYLNQMLEGSLSSKIFFYANTATDGSALYLEDGDLELSNSILTNNNGSGFTTVSGGASKSKHYNNTYFGNQTKLGVVNAKGTSQPILANLIFSSNTGKPIISRSDNARFVTLHNLAYWDNNPLFDNDEDSSSCQKCTQLNPAFRGGAADQDRSYQLTNDSQLLGAGEDLVTIIDDYFDTPRTSGVNDVGASQLKR